MDQPGQPLANAATPAIRIYLLAALVGLLSGALGSVFHWIVEKAVALHTSVASSLAGAVPAAAWIAALLGAVMAAASYLLVVRFAPEAGGSGIQEIEGAMGGLRPIRWLRVMIVKFVGGLLSIGAGLVLGREGPTIHMGGCIGRMISEKMKLGAEGANTLLAAGAGAGLSTAFGAPLAGVLFVTEEMRDRFNYTFVSLHAVALASFLANVMNAQVFGIGPLLPIHLEISTAASIPFPAEFFGFLPLHIGLGVLVGVFGVGFNTVMLRTLAAHDRCGPLTKLGYAAAIGAAAGALLLLAPTFAGGADHLVQSVFAKPTTIWFLLILLVVRTGMTFLSYSTGVPGGIFAPMLAIGSVLGMSFGVIAQQVLPELDMHPDAYALVAMGALFAATVRAPLTGIVLVAELTASFALIPTLIVTCIVASITAQLLGSKPIYESLLDRTLEAEKKS
jgi:CIC family chloride channel protein